MRFSMKAQLGAAGAAALLLTTAGTVPSQAADEIRLSSRSANWDIVLIESGVAAKYDLKIELVNLRTGVEVAEALVGGSVDVGSIGETPLTSLLAQTKDVVVIGTAVSTDGSYAKVIVRKDSPLQTLEDLKGKKIATKIGSGSYRALSDFCAQRGCTINDFEILNTAPAAILAAVESGSVDAGIWFAPTTSIAVAKGFGRIMMDFKGANQGQASWVANRKYAEENPDMVARFLAATIEAQDILVNDHDRAAQLLAQGLQKRGRDLSAEVLKMGLGDFDYSPGVFADRKVSILSGVFDTMKKAGKIRVDKPDFAAALQPQHFEEALKIRAATK